MSDKNHRTTKYTNGVADEGPELVHVEEDRWGFPVYLFSDGIRLAHTPDRGIRRFTSCPSPALNEISLVPHIAAIYAHEDAR